MPAQGTFPFKRALRPIAAALAAAGALGLAAAAMQREAPSVRQAQAFPADTDPSWLETLALHRWGYGALDWLLPDETGDRNDRNRKHAG